MRVIFSGNQTLRATEAILSVSAKPGSVVALNTSDEFILSTADGDDGQLLVLDYDKVKFRELTEAYAADEWVTARQLTSGEPANVLVAASSNINRRSMPLAIGTGGALKIANPAATPPDVVVAYSDEIKAVGAGGAELVAVRGK